MNLRQNSGEFRSLTTEGAVQKMKKEIV